MLFNQFQIPWHFTWKYLLTGFNQLLVLPSESLVSFFMCTFRYFVMSSSRLSLSAFFFKHFPGHHFILSHLFCQFIPFTLASFLQLLSLVFVKAYMHDYWTMQKEYEAVHTIKILLYYEITRRSFQVLLTTSLFWQLLCLPNFKRDKSKYGK